MKAENTARLRQQEQSLPFAIRVVDTTPVSGPYRAALIHAFRTVPRELFVDQALASRVHENISLPLGFGQTLSKPSTVAHMLAALKLSSRDRVLEIGVGSGYVLALLSALGTMPYGIERNPNLARLARSRLDRLGMQTALLKCGDGRRGWADVAPFDAIIISAAFDSVPPALIQQLRNGGKLILPAIGRDAESPSTRGFIQLPGTEREQTLLLWQKVQRGSEFSLEKHVLGPCKFVDAS